MMELTRSWRLVLCGLSLLALASLPTYAQSKGPHHFLYLSDQRVVTVEVVDDKSVYFNYINLSESFELLQAPMLALVDLQGKAYRGHVFRIEGEKDPSKQYSVVQLLSPGKFVGFELLGNFRLESSPQKVCFLVSGRLLELESLSSEQFELIAARIGEMDLERENRVAMIERAGFMRGFGEMQLVGSEEYETLAELLPEWTVLPPVAIANPPPALPPSEAGRPDPVLVKVRATVSKAGGLREITVSEGIDPELDRRAEETVRNAWLFLPAINGNEVAEAEVVLNVIFKR